MTRVVLAAATIALTACGLLGPERREFVIHVDSIGGPTTVSGSASFQQLFYGFVGSDGCYSFTEFRMTRTSTEADVTVVGEHATGGGDCTTAIVTLDGEPLTIDPPVSGPFTLRVHQPDGTVLTRVIQVQ